MLPNAALMPPWAATVWERVGKSLVMQLFFCGFGLGLLVFFVWVGFGWGFGFERMLRPQLETPHRRRRSSPSASPGFVPCRERTGLCQGRKVVCRSRDDERDATQGIVVARDRPDPLSLCEAEEDGGTFRRHLLPKLTPS
jgi:hypothetical protein